MLFRACGASIEPLRRSLQCVPKFCGCWLLNGVPPLVKSMLLSISFSFLARIFDLQAGPFKKRPASFASCRLLCARFACGGLVPGRLPLGGTEAARMGEPDMGSQAFWNEFMRRPEAKEAYAAERNLQARKKIFVVSPTQRKKSGRPRKNMNSSLGPKHPRPIVWTASVGPVPLRPGSPCPLCVLRRSWKGHPLPPYTSAVRA